MKEMANKLREWREHPAQMVEEAFGVKPDPWQAEVLEAFPHHQRHAMKACKGPGKTACLAWLGWNFLATRPHPRCAATSITGDNLRDNFWAEMAKWQNKCEFLRKMFEWTKTRIFAREHESTWWMSARTWPRTADPQAQADALAGLHEDYILFILDESGSIPDSVMATAEAALSSPKEGHIVQAGNPTMRSGPLFRACTIARHLWHVVEITADPDDPKRSSRVSKQWALEQISTYGRDNPWVLVNVFGKFPPSSINVLIGPDEVSAAFKRVYTEHDIGHAARILGVDVARFGDDASVIFPRQGIQCFKPTKRRNINSTQGAGLVARIWDDWDADACFIDNTGGFGSGWIDQLELLGKAPIGVQYSGAPHDPRYYNKRTEMYFDGCKWIMDGGAIPENPELLAALTQTTYTFKNDKLLLEPKEMVKEKLGYSPDDADAFVETFAEPVSPRGMRQRRGRVVSAIPQGYDPFGSLDNAIRQSYGDYDPFRGRD